MQKIIMYTGVNVLEQGFTDYRCKKEKKKKATGFQFGRLTEIIGFFFTVIISDKIMNNPFFGGALYSAGQFSVLFCSLSKNGSKAFLLEKKKLKYYLMMFLAVGMVLCLFIFSSGISGKDQLPLFVLFVLSQCAGCRFVFRQQKTSRNSSTSKGGFLLYSITTIPALAGLFIWRPETAVKWLMVAFHLIILIMIVMIRIFNRHSTGQEIDEIPDNYFDTIQSFMEINTYKFYWHMNSNLSIAFEVSVLVIVCCLPFVPFPGFWSFLFDAVIMAGLYFLAATASKYLLRKRFSDYGKNTVFIVFSLVWIATNYFLYYNVSSLTTIQLSICFLLQCLCITGLASILISMDRDMQMIGEIGLEDFSIPGYSMAKKLIGLWGMLVSRFILTLLTGSMAFIYGLDSEKGPEKLFVFAKYGIALIPGIFLFFAVVAALKQPLTKYYEKKLKKYFTLKAEGKVSKPLEDHLKQGLIEKYKKRIGVKIIISFLKPFFRHKHVGLNHVHPETMPCVFICNHSEIYGPVAAVINMPYFVRPWINSKMVDLQKVSDEIRHGVLLSWIPQVIQKEVVDLISPVVAWAMNSLDPIPVNHGDGRDILKAIDMSIHALEVDDNILLFPENPLITGHYLTDGVGEFFTGFVNIAKAYYKKTGKCLTFYSVFADKRKRTLSFSEGVTFNPAAPFHEEKKRIANSLHDRMVELSGSL